MTMYNVLGGQYVKREKLEAAHALRDATLKTHTLEAVQASLRILVEDYQALSLGRDASHVWYRARPCSADGFSNAEELIYVKNGSPKFGRASLPKHPVLYAGWNKITALDEIRAEAKRHYQITSLRVRQGIQFPCHVLGEMQSLMVSGGSLLNSGATLADFNKEYEAAHGPNFTRGAQKRFRARLFVDSFLAREFRRKAEGSDHYLVSAAYSSLVHNKIGLIYPSVQTARAANLAVTKAQFDENFEVVGSEVVYIEDRAGEGLYALKKVKETEDIAANGDLNWANKRQRAVRVGLFGAAIMDKSVPGWRVRQ